LEKRSPRAKPDTVQSPLTQKRRKMPTKSDCTTLNIHEQGLDHNFEGKEESYRRDRASIKFTEKKGKEKSRKGKNALIKPQITRTNCERKAPGLTLTPGKRNFEGRRSFTSARANGK